MELRILTIHKNLTWQPDSLRPDAACDISAALALLSAAPEGSEMLFCMSSSNAVVDGADGPRIVWPLPKLTPCAKLASGRYVFAQLRPPAVDGVPAWFMASLEEFVRDVWWQDKARADSLVVRLVREDCKAAVQFLCETDAES